MLFIDMLLVTDFITFVLSILKVISMDMNHLFTTVKTTVVSIRPLKYGSVIIALAGPIIHK
jgi:hypothetical protein